MEQAYQNFNSGKYKEALNNLTSNPSNLDSYEPNLAICEYMANRCQQSAINCLRKLNEILARKFKRDQPLAQPHTHNIIKFNIAVLLILQGRRDCALPILEDIYKQKDCFVEFMQSRLLLLIMELYTFTKNPIETLQTHRLFLLRPSQQRGNSNQWASIVFHEHGKTFLIARQEYQLMTNFYLNQALMQIGAPADALSSQEEDDKLKQQLLGRARRRKNNLNKYYEINLTLLGRFSEALRSLYCRNHQKCLSLMNFSTIVEEFDQMPTTKIITNIISAFVNNNAAIVHFHLTMPTVALTYFAKAKALLTKAITGVEDKDLHLFSLNYGSYIEAITFNQALTLLHVRSKDSYQYFQSIRKSSQMSRSYKFWYRMAQSVLQYYHDTRLPSAQRTPLLSTALQALTNSLLCLDKYKVPTSQSLKNLTRFTNLQEQDIDVIVIKLKAEATQFRHSILTLICYVSLGLGLYRRVLRVGQTLLEDKKLDSRNRMNVLHYLLEAQIALGKNALILRQYLQQIQQEVTQESGATKVIYVRTEDQDIEESDYLMLFYHQLMKVNLSEGNIGDAMNSCEYMRQRRPTSLNQSIKDAIAVMHTKYNLDKKFVLPYLKTP